MVLAHKVIDGERTQDIKISQDVTFDTMLLTPQTLQGLKNSGFYKPSPIQLHGIPLGKCGFDLLLEAKSGTGKTAVFTVISLEKVDLRKNVQVIILSPTREIAAQICDVIQQIGSHHKGLRVEVVMGGLSVQEDINKFKNKIHIVVGSPGRLRHLIHDNYIDISSVQLLVLDEADKLLEGNFLPDINYIFSVLPPKKQVIMSSATYPEHILPFVKKYVQNAQHVCPDSNSILIGISQKIAFVKNNANIVKKTQNRFEELLKILSHKQFKQCLIFCNYQARVGELHKMLTREKWPAEQLYGQQEQILRLDALKTLQEYKCRILIATDLAARGIDASNVDLVINFEPPFEWQTYLHRIGRAGRYGSYGIAITIICEGKEEKMFLDMLNSMKFRLELTNYWTNSKFESTVQESLPDTNTSTNETHVYNIKDSYDELWNHLTLENKNLSQNIESFEDLCNSLKKINNSNIEKFSDLLDSFQNMDYSINDNDFNYKHIKNPDVNVNEILYTLKNRDLLKSDEKIDINENIKSYKLDKDNIKGNLNKPLTSSNLNNDLVYNYNDTGYSNAAYTNDEDIEIHNVKNALLKAGLPTAFSSNKHIDKRKLYKDKKQIIKSNLESKPVNITHDIENPEEGNNTSRKCSKDVVSLKDKFTCNTHNYPIYNNTVHLNCNKLNINKKSSISKLNNSKNKLSASSLVSNSQNNCINLDYETWYRQLKTAINYVELSWYVHEISQM